ncbi:MAG: AGE family epimerase/isomerase [Pseudomonadota bacterium]
MDDFASTGGRPQAGDSAVPGEASWDLSRRLWAWLAETALPLWWRVGADHEGGGFHEALGQDGVPAALPRRCRVQPRQIYSFSLAARLGWRGPARRAAEHGLSYFLDRFRRPDGLFRASVEIDGRARDDRALLYDQAFALLGLYGAHDLDPRPDLRGAAEELLDRIRRQFKYSGGGFREDDAAPFQSNAQMHLFEACIAWGAVAGGPFAETADEIGALCLHRLIDPETGAIDEVYDGGWRPVAPGGGAGAERRIEPGHQFEWAWLLMQWDKAGARGCRGPAERLFAAGEASVHRSRHVVPAAMSPDGRVFEPLARLWPQTERLRTAVLLAGEAGADRAAYERAALDAGAGLLTFLQTPIAGLWRDKLLPDGAFVEEAAPASSLYHLAGAIGALKDKVGGVELPTATSPKVSETAR